MRPWNSVNTIVSGFFPSGIACVSAAVLSVPQEQHWAEILEERVIARKVERHITFPDYRHAGLVALADGNHLQTVTALAYASLS